MELIKDNWTKKDYDDFLSYLISNGDERKKKFDQKLIPDGTKKMIGLKANFIRSVAKEIAKGNAKSFLEIVRSDYYEEVLIEGLILSLIKISFDELIIRLDSFIPKISNWAEVDMTARFKQFDKNQELGLDYINKLIDSNFPWHIRYALILLLSHYLNDTYIINTLNICKAINNDHYYVKMANAWLISTAYVKYKKETEKLLTEKNLDKFTQNKAIQKIRESFRVDINDKERLNLLKIK